MSLRTVITLDAAAKDLDAGRAFYDAREPGIGLYFVDSLVSEIESLQLFGGIHGRKFGFFRMLCKRFPFAIYYDIQGSTVRVAAILDMRRNPVWIREELLKRKN